jgi:hypothetical protein
LPCLTLRLYLMKPKHRRKIKHMRHFAVSSRRIRRKERTKAHAVCVRIQQNFSVSASGRQHSGNYPFGSGSKFRSAVAEMFNVEMGL